MLKTIELKLFMAYVVLTYGLVEISHSFAGNVLLLPSCRATPLVMVQHCSGQGLGCTPDQAEFAKTAQFFLVFSKPQHGPQLLSSHFLSSCFHSLGAEPTATVQRSSGSLTKKEGSFRKNFFSLLPYKSLTLQFHHFLLQLVGI